MAAEATIASNELQAEAFKQLYPEQYYAKFINSNLRPDGRPLDGARATTIGINPIGTADSSALVKIGETTAMAGIKLGVRQSPVSLGLLPHVQFLRLLERTPHRECLIQEGRQCDADTPE